MPSNLIIDNLYKRFATEEAIKHIDLTIPSGKLTCFLGPSGCGKTTLLRMICGLEAPTAGRIRLGDENLTFVPARKRNFGMVFQTLALFPNMTVAGNIAYPLRLRHFDKNEQARRVGELLELIQLPHLAGRTVAQLSGGQRQRVAIARALASAPSLLLLDEPLSALDAKLREAMQVEIRLLQRRLGITTIMVTHDQREAMSIADVVVVMDRGTVAQVGTPLHVYREPATEFVANFIGHGNIIPAVACAGSTVCLVNGRPIQTSSPRPFTSDGECRLLIRPEDILLHTSESSQGEETNYVAGTVEFIRDIGSSLEATIACVGFSLTVSMSPREVRSLRIGRSVSATLPTNACRVIDIGP